MNDTTTKMASCAQPSHLDLQSNALLEEFKAYKDELRDSGAFDTHPSFSVSQAIQALALLGSSLACLHFGGWLLLALGSLLLGIYYCLCAYISHDVAHGQATRARKGLEQLFSALCLAQGLSLTWWKRKHSIHHANTNVYKIVNGEPVPVDGDIDTMPLFCWSPKLLGTKEKSNPIYVAWLKAQRFLIWPFFPILRLQWIYFGLTDGTNKERALIIAHHGAIFGLASLASSSGPLSILAMWLGANAIAGTILTSFFLFGHSGMHVRETDEQLDEFREQARTTRNFSCNPLVTWLSGGLNYQIEHHLFPTLPRSMLPKVAARIEQMAKAHGEPYYVDSIPVGFYRIYKSLDTGM
jgi:fatty acid desaturase